MCKSLEIHHEMLDLCMAWKAMDKHSNSFQISYDSPTYETLAGLYKNKQLIDVFMHPDALREYIEKQHNGPISIKMQIAV